jgi:hypothetical protein
MGCNVRWGRILEIRFCTIILRRTVSGKYESEGGKEKLRIMSRRMENWRRGWLTGTRRKVVWEVMIGNSCHVVRAACGFE